MTAAMLIFGFLTVLAACGVIFARKPLNSALSLVLTLFMVAVHFALLGADFVATIQVMVYAGAIMVLVIFVIMLLGIGELRSPRGERFGRVLAALGSGIFVALLYLAVQYREILVVHLPVVKAIGEPLSGAPVGNTEEIGQALFSKFVYPFEIASVLLLAAIIGAVVLGLEAKRPLAKERGLKAMHREGPV